MAVNVFFSLACTTLAFWYCISSSSGVGNDVSENTWKKLDPVAQRIIMDVQKKYIKKISNIQKKAAIIRKKAAIIRENAEYKEFICATNIIRRCEDVLYRDVTSYLRIKYIREHWNISEDDSFEQAFDEWRSKTYKSRGGAVHRVIFRICPKNQIQKGKATEKEFFDFIEHSESKRAQKLRELFPTYIQRKYVAALLPCSFYQMCTYLHQGNSLAMKMFRNGTKKSLTKALLTYNWRMNSMDIRHFNKVLSIISNVKLTYKTITSDGVVFPMADLKTGCDID